MGCAPGVVDLGDIKACPDGSGVIAGRFLEGLQFLMAEATKIIGFRVIGLQFNRLVKGLYRFAVISQDGKDVSAQVVRFGAVRIRFEDHVRKGEGLVVVPRVNRRPAQLQQSVMICDPHLIHFDLQRRGSR